MTLDVGWATCAGQSGQRDKSGERSKSVEWELGEGVDRWGGETEGGRRERMRDRERQGTCRQRFVQAPFVVEREPTHARPVGGRSAWSSVRAEHPGREGVWQGTDKTPKHANQSASDDHRQHHKRRLCRTAPCRGGWPGVHGVAGLLAGRRVVRWLAAAADD